MANKGRTRGKTVEPEEEATPQDKDGEEQTTQYGAHFWPLAKVRLNPEQPRQTKDKVYYQEMEDLKQSILALGQLQPIIVSLPDENGVVDIIDGERRFTALTELNKKGKLTAGTIKVTFEDVADRLDQFVLSFGANCCRADMPKIDIAHDIEKLMSQDYTVEQVAQIAGKSTAWVYNMLKYLKLDPKVQQMLSSGEIASDVALAVSAYPLDKQLSLARDLLGEMKKKGGSFSAQELALTISRQAKQRGVKPRPNKKGKVQLAFEVKLLRGCATLGKALLARLEEAANISTEELQNTGYDNFSALQQILEKLDVLLPQIHQVVKNLKKKMESLS